MTELIIEALLINLSLCLDAFVAGIAYGAGKIKLPFFSLIIINLICTAFLAFSLFIGRVAGGLISEDAAKWFSFGLLLCIGIIKLAGHFNACKNPAAADKDNSRHISAAEAAALAVALSIDGLAVGFGAGLSTAAVWWIIGLSLLTDPAALLGGKTLGSALASKTKINLGFLSGVLLILLAVLKVV